jgi:hypothetical protein
MNNRFYIFVIAQQVSEVDQRLLKTIVTVTGAGAPEIDGQYSFVRLEGKAGMFQKAPTMYHGKSTVFSLYRCKLQNYTYSWFISDVPEGEDPGTRADKDYYCAPSSYMDGYVDMNDLTPPSHGWESVSEYGIPPAPKIVVFIDGETIDELDDREDSMVVMDDESSSQADDMIPNTSGLSDSLDYDGNNFA